MAFLNCLNIFSQQLNREGLGPQDESVAQEKLEATAENNSTSDHSSSSKTCTLGQELINKKGSDAQVRNLFLVRNLLFLQLLDLSYSIV